MNFADLSHHNPDPINWSVYETKRDRVALKATQGTDFIDPKFAERWKNTKGHRMAYHFLMNNLDGAKQFDHFLDVINKAGGLRSSDTLVVDFEHTNDATRVPIPGGLQTLQAFINRAVQKSNKYAIVYSYRYYMNYFRVSADKLHPLWRHLWIATYTANLPDSSVSLPEGWNRDQVVARQYTDQADVAGVTGKCDDSRILHDWLTNNQPPVGDWWETVDQATAQATMEKAVKNVFNIHDDMNVPYGMSSNDNVFATLIKIGQTNYNILNAIDAAIDAVKSGTELQGDDEANVVAKLEEVKNLITNATTVVP